MFPTAHGVVSQGGQGAPPQPVAAYLLPQVTRTFVATASGAALAVPTDGSTGNYAVIAVTVTGAPSISPPAGFELLAHRTHDSDATLAIRVYGGRTTGGATLDFAWSGARAAVARALYLTNVDEAAPVAGVETISDTGSASRDLFLPDVAIDSSGTIAVALVAGNVAAESSGFQNPTSGVGAGGGWATTSGRRLRDMTLVPFPGMSRVRPPSVAFPANEQVVGVTLVLNRVAGTPPEAMIALDRELGPHLVKTAGYAWGVFRDGALIDSDASGYIIPSGVNQLAWSTGAKSPVASVSKLITSIAVMELHQQAELDINEPAYSYLAAAYPDPPAAGVEGITIEQLMRMTAGVTINGQDTLEKAVSVVVADFLTTAPTYAPGTKYHYNNCNYAVLQAVIEEVTGEPYAAWVQDHIFTPLGVTGDADGPVEAPRIYTATGDSPVTLDSGLYTTIAAHGWTLSVEDLGAVLAALHDDTLITNAADLPLYTDGLHAEANDRTGLYGRTGSSSPDGVRGLRVYAARLDDRHDAVILTNSYIPSIDTLVDNVLSNTEAPFDCGMMLNGGDATPVTGTNVSVTLPKQVRPGDLIVLAGFTRSAATTPAGYTLVLTQSGADFGQLLHVYTRVADGSEGGTTVTLTQGSSGRMGLAFSVLRSSTGGLAVEDSAGYPMSGAGIGTIPTLSASGKGRIALTAITNPYGEVSGATFMAPPSGFTLLSLAGRQDNRLGLAYRVLPEDGVASGSWAITGPNGPYDGSTATVILGPTPTSP